MRHVILALFLANAMAAPLGTGAGRRAARDSSGPNVCFADCPSTPCLATFDVVFKDETGATVATGSIGGHVISHDGFNSVTNQLQLGNPILITCGTVVIDPGYSNFPPFLRGMTFIIDAGFGPSEASLSPLNKFLVDNVLWYPLSDLNGGGGGNDAYLELWGLFLHAVDSANPCSGVISNPEFEMNIFACGNLAESPVPGTGGQPGYSLYVYAYNETAYYHVGRSSVYPSATNLASFVPTLRQDNCPPVME